MKDPNLLFIFTDQQRRDTLGCYGNQLAKTPNLDALATQSSLYERPYVSQPICTPSRSTLLTGLYPHSTGCTFNNLHLSPDVPTIAEMLPDSWDKAYFGKWQKRAKQSNWWSLRDLNPEPTDYERESSPCP